MQLFNPSLCWAVDYEWYYRMLQNSRVRYLRTNYIRSHHGHKGQISQTIDIQKVRQSDNETLRKMYVSHLRIRLFLFIGKSIHKFLLALHRKRTH